MVLNFDAKNVISDSNIISYLLEKSRVTKRDPKERNYHVFYQLLRGMDEKVLKKWGMSPNCGSYRYLLAEGEGPPSDLNDAENFEEMVISFRRLGFTDAEAQHFFEVCGVVW